MLDIRRLLPAISDLAAEGYNWVSLSGGEPILYQPLPQLFRHAKAQGLQTTMVSNGMLLTRRQLDRIHEHLDLLVISLDGNPESHNSMRGSERAFELMASRLENIRERGMPFGFIFTLTQHNLDELPWVAEFAANSGARLLQIHPLEDIGNAARRLRGRVPDSTEGAYAWVLGQQIQKNSNGRMAVQVDLLHSNTIAHSPGLVYADAAEPAGDCGLSELMSPLVVEPDGSVVPLQYGFPRQLGLGNLCQEDIPTMARRWRERQWPRFQSLCRKLHREIVASPEPSFLNWYERIAETALFEFGQPVAPPRSLGSSPIELAG